MPTIKLPKRKHDNVRTTRKVKYQDIYQDPRWRAIRDAKKRNNPLCERCEEKGLVTPAKEIHHKIPFDCGRTEEEIEELAFDYDNTKSVCDSCHTEEHKELDRMRVRDKF